MVPCQEWFPGLLKPQRTQESSSTPFNPPQPPEPDQGASPPRSRNDPRSRSDPRTARRIKLPAERDPQASWGSGEGAQHSSHGQQVPSLVRPPASARMGVKSHACPSGSSSETSESKGTSPTRSLDGPRGSRSCFSAYHWGGWVRAREPGIALRVLGTRGALPFRATYCGGLACRCRS